MKKNLIFVIYVVLLVSARCEPLCQIPLDNKYILTGLEYNSKSFVPTPFIGVWFDFYYDPTKSHNRGHRSLSYEFITSINPDEYSMKMVVTEDLSSSTLISKRRVSDWSLGYTADEAQRRDIIEGKYLLDYNKPLKPLPSGVLPPGLVIRKYLVASNAGSELFFVVYESDSLEKIKAYHRIPAYFKRSKGDDFWYTSI